MHVYTLWSGNWKGRMEKWFLVLTFAAILAKTDPKNEEEEKRRIEARREKQRRRREKNSEKYGDGYRFVFSRVWKLVSLKQFPRKCKYISWHVKKFIRVKWKCLIKDFWYYMHSLLRKYKKKDSIHNGNPKIKNTWKYSILKKKYMSLTWRKPQSLEIWVHGDIVIFLDRKTKYLEM